MLERPTVDDLLARSSPIAALPGAVDMELSGVIMRAYETLSGGHASADGLRALESNRHAVMLYLARRVDRFEDSAPRFVSTAHRVGRVFTAVQGDADERRAAVFRVARSTLRENRWTPLVQGEALALRHALRAVPPVGRRKDSDVAELDWHLRQLISYADPVDAEIVRLVAWERLGVDAAALILRIREASARERFSRTRALLAEQLHESGDLGPSV